MGKVRKDIIIADSKNTARIVLRGNNLFFEFGLQLGMAYMKVDISEMFPSLMYQIIRFAKQGGFDEYLQKQTTTSTNLEENK